MTNLDTFAAGKDTIDQCLLLVIRPFVLPPHPVYRHGYHLLTQRQHRHPLVIGTRADFVRLHADLPVPFFRRQLQFPRGLNTVAVGGSGRGRHLGIVGRRGVWRRAIGRGALWGDSSRLGDVFISHTSWRITEMIWILYGFPCEMDFVWFSMWDGFVWFSMWDGFVWFSMWDVFSQHKSQNFFPPNSETSGDKSISHWKPYNFLTYFTLNKFWFFCLIR